MFSTFVNVLQRFPHLATGHPLRVLDFGCGKSLFGRRASQEGDRFDVHLFDVSDNYENYWGFVRSEKRAQFSLPPSWAQKFDVVTSLFSLEHVERPLEVLADIRRLLRPDGVVYVVLPNPYGDNISDYLVVDHVQHFSINSFRK